jgi:hypothetical protein
MENSTISTYTPPVDQLLTYDKPDVVEAKDWPDYLALGISSEHIPDLIRMAIDPQLNKADEDEGNLTVWAPTHAWRALGQLRAEAAIKPLLTLFTTLEESEWAGEELPDVFGMIGPVALPALAEYIADSSYDEWARVNAIGCIEKIGEKSPEAHSQCIEILSRQLEHFREKEYEFNAFLILALAARFKAVEAAPLIERAFAAQAVDESIMGDWDEVQVELGLKSREEVPQKNFSPFLDLPPLFTSESATEDVASKHRKKELATKKTRNKMARQSRKKNRKR